MAKKDIVIGYVEPDDYFPKELRKKYKLGEYAETEKETDEKQKMTTASKSEHDGGGYPVVVRIKSGRVTFGTGG